MIETRELMPAIGPVRPYPPIGVSASLGMIAARRITRLHLHLQSTALMRKSRKRRSRRKPMSRALRLTIRKRDLTAYAAAKQAGVSVDAVQRFMNAERGLTLTTVDKLADALDLTLCSEDPPSE